MTTVNFFLIVDLQTQNFIVINNEGRNLGNCLIVNYRIRSPGLAGGVENRTWNGTSKT